MSNDTRYPFYPATRRDVALLRQTATDAVNDLGSTAVVHTLKAKNQLKGLTDDFKVESGDYLEQTQGRLRDWADSARSYASEHPLACVSAALATGFILGLSWRRTRRS